jgi:hypothetical protein
MTTRKEPATTCVCGGVGYLQRVTDHAMVKCVLCDGTGTRLDPPPNPFGSAKSAR